MSPHLTSSHLMGHVTDGPRVHRIPVIPSQFHQWRLSFIIFFFAFFPNLKKFETVCKPYLPTIMLSSTLSSCSFITIKACSLSMPAWSYFHIARSTKAFLRQC